jgi:hypothetical protein
MTLPANLFVDTPEMEDVSLHHLSSNVEEWPEEIITKVKERLPRAGGMNMMVKFMKKDDENGCATGSVVAHSSDKSAIIPIIVKDFMLYPLDVFIADKKLLPLNPNYFDAVFSKNELFDKIEEYPTFGGLGRFEDANLWNAIYPPSLGRYAYASAGYPILDSIAETIDGTALSGFLKEPGNAKYAARLLAGPHAEVIRKVANLRPVNMNEFTQGVTNLIPRSVVMLRRGGPNKYSLLSNSDTVFHPGVMHMNRHEMMQNLSTLCEKPEDEMNDVDQNGEKFLVLPTPKNNVILAKEDQEVPESADEFGHYVVKAKTGVEVEGVVVPHVVDFDQKRVDLKVFLGKTMSTIQPNIFGVRVKNSRFNPLREQCHPQIGQTGTFLYMADSKHGLCTIPVTIHSVTDDCGQLSLKAHDLMGRAMKLHLQSSSGPGSVQRIVKTGPGEYMLPHSMRWVAMEDFGEVTNSVDDYAVKQAGARKTDWPVTVIGMGQGGYAIRGADKYASAMGVDKTNLDAGTVRFLLASLGAGQDKIAMAFDHIRKFGAAEFHNLNRVPLFAEKVAKARPLAAKIAAVANGLRCNLWKEASMLQGLSKKASALENSQTVDALLSLNFVNPDNVSKYVGKLPSLKSAVSHLASCLLASRLGMKEIPELAASTAMVRLVEVVDGLEKLKATHDIAAQQG